MYDETSPTPALEQLGLVAAAVAEDLLSQAGSDSVAASGGGSRQRGLPEDLRMRFIAVRKAMYERGIYVPLLARFDTATVAQASTREIAEELARVAAVL